MQREKKNRERISKGIEATSKGNSARGFRSSFPPLGKTQQIDV
jgi:hypothetical protein